MANGTVLKAVVVERGSFTSGGAPMRLALFSENGDPITFNTEGDVPIKQAEAVKDSEATTIKELVADYNAFLAHLRDAGLIAS